MQKGPSFLKILLLNLAFFLVLVTLIEAFFILNKTAGFLPPRDFSKPLLTEVLSPEATVQKYGIDVRAVPDEARSPINSEIFNDKNFQIDYSRRQRLTETLPYDKKNKITTLRVTVKTDQPFKDQLIYTADYKTDTYDRRVVENQNTKTLAKNFILLLGDSFAFGEGVTTGFDLASQLAKKIGPNWKVYNFGHSGISTADMLGSLSGDVHQLDGITESQGVAIWYFIEPQLERFLCTLKCYYRDYDEYVSAKPNYELEDGKLVFKGRFSDSQGLKRKALNFFGHSETLRFLNFGVSDYTERQFFTYAFSISEIGRIIKARYNLKKLYVLNTNDFANRAKFFNELRIEGISVIDLADLNYEGSGVMYIPGDGHPTGGRNWITSEAIKHELEKEFAL